jgi:hypothetical protein
MTPSLGRTLRLLWSISAFLVLGVLNSCQFENPGNPGNTPNIAPQSSYRIVGDVGTPFQAIVSDSRSSWQVAGTVPTSLIVVNDSPPDRILVTKTANDGRLLSLQVLQGVSVGTLDSTVNPFGTAVGSIGGTLHAFANPASPDVRFIVKSPLAGVSTGLIEDASESSAIESRIPVVILFDFPNGGKPGRVDGIFTQVIFSGVMAVDLLINGQLVQSVSGGSSVTVQGRS